MRPLIAPSVHHYFFAGGLDTGVIILCSLTVNGASRYNELLHNVQGISNTMLSQTLKELERDHLVLRKEYLEVPVRVEYELSEQAKKLQPILIQLIQWKMGKDAGS